jgi:hypothetical protein
MTTTVPETYPSFRALIRLVLQSALPRPQKAVLQAMLAYARPDLTVYHAQGQLAWECDYTRPTIKQALRALKAQAILRVLGTPRQHSATEYAIDLSRLPSRAPYYAKTRPGDVVSGDEAIHSPQRVNTLPPATILITNEGMTDVPADVPTPPTQGATGLPADEPGGQWLPLSGPMTSPQVVQEEEKKHFLSHAREAPGVRVTTTAHPHPALPRKGSQPGARRSLETSAPDTLPVTEALRHWAAEAVPGLPLDREREKFLCYARAHGVTNVEWAEALKGWWLEAYDRAVRRGDLQRLAVPTPAPTPEPPPLYDAELHAQMRADITRLCIPERLSVPETDDGQGPCRRRVSSALTAEGLMLERDPSYLARMRARKAMLQTQAVFLQAQVSGLEVAGIAD